jgi:hypothetical protein
MTLWSKLMTGLRAFREAFPSAGIQDPEDWE